jgi:DNA-binding XRE family transcriptional regulator
LALSNSYMGMITIYGTAAAVKVVSSGTHMAIFGNQIKAARALVGLGQHELAKRAAISVNTIRNMEARGMGRVRVRSTTIDALKVAFRTVGVALLEDDEEIGVVLTRTGVELLED